MFVNFLHTFNMMLCFCTEVVYLAPTFTWGNLARKKNLRWFLSVSNEKIHIWCITTFWNTGNPPIFSALEDFLKWTNQHERTHISAAWWSKSSVDQVWNENMKINILAWLNRLHEKTACPSVAPTDCFGTYRSPAAFPSPSIISATGDTQKVS